MPGPDDSPLEDDSVLARGLQEARLRLYRPGATEADREMYRCLSERVAALQSAADVVDESAKPKRLRLRPLGGKGLPVALGAGALLAVVAALQPTMSPPQQPVATASPPALRFDLVDTSLRQRLAQYPATVQPPWQGAAIAAEREDVSGFTMLTVPDQYLGREQLLVVRCPTSAESWEAHMFSSTYGAKSLIAEGQCGPISTLPVSAGIGAVSVQVDGEGRFDSALLAGS